MSQVYINATRPATRKRVLAALSQIVGRPLTAARRAADMRVFHFGTLRQVERGQVGDFALHIQCPWRIESSDRIITGRSDLWTPVDADAPYDENWDYERSPNVQDARIQQWMERDHPLVVTRVDADEFGGVVIHFDLDCAIRLFPSGSCGEDWRLFRPGTGTPHLVISGGEIEADA